MFTVVYKAATFQCFARQIVYVLSACETPMFTNLEKKQSGCSVTHQFSLPNVMIFLGLLSPRTVTFEKDQLGPQFVTYVGPVAAEL